MRSSQIGSMEMTCVWARANSVYASHNSCFNSTAKEHAVGGDFDATPHDHDQPARSGPVFPTNAPELGRKVLGYL
jgi:hypothetical protein